MELSPLSKVINPWGAPALDGYDTDGAQPGMRLKGANRQYVRFYTKRLMEVQADKIKENPRTGEIKVLSYKSVEVDREFVHIITPGDTNSVEDFAQDFHKREHWPQYKAFRDGRTAPIGTSIEDCAFISSHIATELRYFGVQTLEQFADSSDDLCNRIANGWELREFARTKVKAELANVNGGQVILLQTELEKSQQVIAELQEQMKMVLADRTGKVEKVIAKPKRAYNRKVAASVEE